MKNICKLLLLLISIIIVYIRCVDVEDLLVFANESGHVSEYHLKDSLSHIPDNQWKFIDNLGAIKTDAIWVKGDTAQRFEKGRKLEIFFNGRDISVFFRSRYCKNVFVKFWL